MYNAPLEPHAAQTKNVNTMTLAGGAQGDGRAAAAGRHQSARDDQVLQEVHLRQPAGKL